MTTAKASAITKTIPHYDLNCCPECDGVSEDDKPTISQSAEDTLLAAMSRIEDPKNWTTIVLAKDANGFSIGPCDPSATQWCAIGSLKKEVHNEVMAGNPPDEYNICFDFLNRASEILHSRDHVSDVNDLQGHEDTMAVYQAAAEMFKGERCRNCCCKEEDCHCEDASK